MGFDVEKYKSAKLLFREEKVGLTGLDDFFPEGEKQEWKIRNLTASELAKINVEVGINRNLPEIAEKLLESIHSDSAAGQVKAILAMYGVSDEVPDDTVKRIMILKYGSVDPEIDQEFAVKMADSHPIQFKIITDRIFLLTGYGKRLGE